MPMESDSAVRIAGGLLIVVIVIGIYSLAYVPGHPELTGQANSVIDSITAHEAMYRFGIVWWLPNCVAFVLLPLAFYKMFHAVNRQDGILRPLGRSGWASGCF